MTMIKMEAIAKNKHSQQSLSGRLILESFKKTILRWEVEQQLNLVIISRSQMAISLSYEMRNYK